MFVEHGRLEANHLAQRLATAKLPRQVIPMRGPAGEGQQTEQGVFRRLLRGGRLASGRKIGSLPRARRDGDDALLVTVRVGA